MPRTQRRPVFAALSLLALAGCGGSGGTAGDPPVQPLALTHPGGYSAIVGVRDDGAMFGYEMVTDTPVRYTAAFWPTPGRLETVPTPESNTHESLVDLSPDRELLLGVIVDPTQAGLRPQRAFVYRRRSGDFRILQIGLDGQSHVAPVRFSDNQTVLGSLSTPTEGGGTATVGFVYHLDSDTFEVTPPPGQNPTDPGFPAEASERQATAYSSNRAYAAGQLTLNGHKRFAVWSISRQTVRLVGPSDTQGFGEAISDDGTVAVFAGAVLPNKTWISKADGSFDELLEYLRSQGVGTNWERVGPVSLSPNGRYLSVTGMNGDFFSTAARIHLN